MQEHWIKNIEEKWVICYDDCVICKSNTNLNYKYIKTKRTLNSLKVELMDVSSPVKKFIPFYQCKEFEDLVKNLERPTTLSLLCNSTRKLFI